MGVLARSETLVAAITETVHLVPSLLCLGNIQESINLLLEKSHPRQFTDLSFFLYWEKIKINVKSSLKIRNKKRELNHNSRVEGGK